MKRLGLIALALAAAGCDNFNSAYETCVRVGECLSDGGVAGCC